MIKQQKCKQCGCSFMGGPRAFYCPSCRHIRSQQSSKDCKQRRKAGHTRPLGSTDKCCRCGNLYIVNSPAQLFCPDCQRPHALEHDRVIGIAYYHANKIAINPARNEKRRAKTRVCKWCGKEFDPKGTRAEYCSDSCRRAGKNKLWMDRYYSKNK